MDRVTFSLAGRRVFVAGHRGMVGSALVRRLALTGCETLTAGRELLDLRDQRATFDWLAAQRPDAVFIAAARVGGILANSTRPADFIYDNLIIQANLIEGARRAGVEKLLFLGSSCIYPKFATQPITEGELLAGPLEPTNEWYAIAKISGIKLCQAYSKQYDCRFISAMPTNLYGPGDNFDLRSSHVLPAMMAKLHAAKLAGSGEVAIWGSGTPRREFLHADDLADACVFLMERYEGQDHVNVGTGADLTIAALADLIAETVGWRGRFVYQSDMPDGTPRKLLDVTRLDSLGWRARIDLREGVARTYDWFLAHAAHAGIRVA
ncbi:MAG TPA: GDP-L-fucose synthase [Bradyrhizobium sp.]|nr:GDP-L-fucose synthase [Bradyrhizobium sp.]